MKKVLITGAASGIGFGAAQLLSQEGYEIFIADIDDAGRQAASSLGCEFIHCDVSEEESVKNCMEKASANGGLYGLVNNAGIADPRMDNLSEASLSYWQRVIDTNLTGVFLCSKYASMKMNDGGRIINISSTRARQSEKNTFAYSASKGGVLSLTHCLAVSLGPDILVNSISPGWINTDESYTPTEVDNKQHPAGRIGNPQDTASLISYLLSESSSFITGQDFVIDGGMSTKMIYED